MKVNIIENEKISSFEEKLGYIFKNKMFLTEALTHSSYANELHNGTQCNERLEFLGDAVISIITAEYLYERFPKMQEGKLSKLRASLVCTQSLSKFAKELGVSDYILLGKGEKNSNGAQRPTILENAFEAIIAAVYLDGGIESAKKTALRFIENEVDNHHVNFFDYKSHLQEIIQKNPDETLNYIHVGESGPDHDKRFVCEVHLNSNVIGCGIGKTKKSAEQNAAKEALELMGVSQ